MKQKDKIAKPIMNLHKRKKDIEREIIHRKSNVVIIFIDMAGSTTYKDEKGIVAGVDKVISFNLNVTEIIKKKGNEYKKNNKIEEYEICKYIGDEVMAYFIGKDCANIVLEIAADIQKYFRDINMEKRDELEKFKPKIGIDFGEVLFVDYFKKRPFDPTGLFVDRAARIVGLAKPCQILISDSVKKQIRKSSKIKISQGIGKKLRGISEKTKIFEVIWDIKLGIKSEEEPFANVISPEDRIVSGFINDHNLLRRSKQVDLYLYSCETVVGHLRANLEAHNSPITFRVLIRDPSEDIGKENQIRGSISTMTEIRRMNPKVYFDVHIYKEEPLLRALIFHKKNGKSEGLLSLYRHDPGHAMKFVGVEGNIFIYVSDRSHFERIMMKNFQSRFDYAWNKSQKVEL